MISKILGEIIKNKKKGLELDKIYFPLLDFKGKLEKSKKDYILSLAKGKLHLIAEIKPKSPSKGILKHSINIIEIVNAFETQASCISVLTESKFFGGSLKLLKLVSAYSKLPVLRKDFIIDEYQIYQSRFYGADAILLIASLLSSKKMQKFLNTSKSLGMACQVEIHNESDLNKVLKTDAQLIGINNRDLNTMEIDLNTTIKLSKKIPPDKIIISESGIVNHEDIKKIREYIDAVHIGSAFMESENIKSKINEIMGVKNEATN